MIDTKVVPKKGNVFFNGFQELPFDHWVITRVMDFGNTSGDATRKPHRKFFLIIDQFAKNWDPSKYEDSSENVTVE
jgi:hypothetical protein